MKKGLFTLALLSLLLVGCGGSGGDSGTPGGSWDGQGTSLPAADTGSSIIIDHQEAYATVSLIPELWMPDARLQQVMFGHQSVGGNILGGLSDLAGHSSRYNVRIITFPDTDGSGCVSQFSVGSNGDPNGKITDFVDHVNGGEMATASVAMFKLCYVDFDSGTDANALFTTYKNAMTNLESTYPGVKFVYWTAPLTTDYLESRQTYNELVRNYCKSNNKILFDIADIEAYSPSNVVTNASQPTLYSGYTSDGGHLNSTGSIRVARAWWWLMARISGWDGQS